MRFAAMLLPLAALALAPVAAAEEAPDAKPGASEQSQGDYISFPNRGGVRNWRAVDRDTIYFQDRRKRWFKAELSRPAFDLPFTIFIGIEEGTGGRLDKWSSVYVKGERYHFSSFERIEGEPPKRKKGAEG
jgi:hypothetical protein